MMEVDYGGWLAPLVLLLASRRVAAVVFGTRPPAGVELLPPSREVRGTLSLREVVVASEDRVPRSVPIDLELRAGDSIAVLCDAASDRELLVELLSGRRLPLEGEVAVDGVALGREDSLVAVVGPGEKFLPGGLETNVGALCDDPPDRGTLTAVVEACGLDEVEEALGEALVAADGSPLEPLHRLLVQAARVVPSHYRMLVVSDPMPWVNAVRAELWRSAVVRASVGRTAIWITADRDLASRAGQVVEFRQGSLRQIEG
jgi:ABC-type transport system involved in cytochrome bd biosynthesis fused ATPase/permease subunit